MQNQTIQFLDHSTIRAAQRGITEKMIKVTVNFGKVFYRQGLRYFICLEKKLKVLGIDSIDSASTGQNAIDAIIRASKSGRPFTIAFIDMIMPIMDGWEFMDEIVILKSQIKERIQIQKIIQEVSDYSQLCTQLDILLRESVNNISGELSLATQHCLMKDFSLQHERYKKIYSAWKETAKQGAL